MVKMQVEVMDSFSAHGDRQEMLEFLANQKKTVKKLFLVHGDLDAQKSFRALLKKNGFKDVQIPELGSVFKLN